MPFNVDSMTCIDPLKGIADKPGRSCINGSGKATRHADKVTVLRDVALIGVAQKTIRQVWDLIGLSTVPLGTTSH